ncbi:MAG TPA: carbamoyl phosphate synthase small subunit [Firmicutes bacterium]|nr:glutamine-hydrolyzing carbamoyl-phosphate synthase small subunit [Bacillales bacterium]HJA42021.1 carbamoyl phosphate synthase small subunit [Bacillota bacterium]
MTKRLLILEDGTFFEGKAFGASVEKTGEVVFNTGMTGYQEILTDPSYCDQIVCLTYPLIGNYGINRDDFESIKPSVHGLIVKEACDTPSNFRSQMTLHKYLEINQIPGIMGIDTRKLTRLIRSHGTMKGRLCNGDVDVHAIVEELKNTSLMTDQVSRVSTKSTYSSPGKKERIVLMDFGMKHGILRELNDRGCDVRVVPYNTTAEEILNLKPDGIMLSNGPGDPKDVPVAIDTVRTLLGKVPLFGICLGHQLFALACGADTIRLKFGHRGSNHPVKNLETKEVYITSQNHGYTVDLASLEGKPIHMTHIAVNDGTCEGLRHDEFPAFTVQYHPEASPGPEDANLLFDQFIEMIRENKKQK